MDKYVEAVNLSAYVENHIRVTTSGRAKRSISPAVVEDESRR